MSYDDVDHSRGGVDGPIMMSEQEESEAELAARHKAEAIALAAALHTILSETDDAEATRICIGALSATQTGRDYLAANPIHY